jgi:hypothetical protein
MKIPIPETILALSLFQPVSSIVHEIIFSRTANTVEAAANVIKMKKKIRI